MQILGLLQGARAICFLIGAWLIRETLGGCLAAQKGWLKDREAGGETKQKMLVYFHLDFLNTQEALYEGFLAMLHYSLLFSIPKYLTLSMFCSVLYFSCGKCFLLLLIVILLKIIITIAQININWKNREGAEKKITETCGYVCMTSCPQQFQ